MFLINLLPKNFKKLIRNRLLNFINQSPSITQINESLESLQVSICQINESLKIYNQLHIPPPEALQRRIVGGYFGDFISSGFLNIDDFNNALSNYGRTLSDFDKVLDFGCGCGRVFMPLSRKYPHLKIYGSDIDAEAINYCREVYASIGEFVVNNDKAPSVFQDEFFDLVYGISVFTHLPESMQIGWLADLKRITKPGAFLLLSIENKKSQVILKGDAKEEFEETGLYYHEGPLTEGLPEYYRTTIHSHEYIHNEWSKFFDVLEIIPKGMMGHQDLVVCRRRSD